MPTIGQLMQLVGNPNVYAVQKNDGTYYPVREPITPQVLRRHLNGEITVGTYLVRPPDQARTLVLDFDSGFETAMQEAEATMQALQKLGIPERGLAVEFSGSKGYHVWVVSAQYLPARQLQALGRAALALAGVDGEVYPKQAEVRDLGNLVKLPGGVHRVSGKRAEYTTSPPQPIGLAVLRRVLDALPQEAVRVRTSVGGPPVLECMAAIQEGAEQGWRNHGMFHFATSLRRAGVLDAAVLAAMEAVNAEFDPPLDPEEFVQVFESSRNSGPICSQLPKDVQCEDCPFRRSGLSTRKGQLRNGTDGEMAVVQLGVRNKSGAIELLHPDIRKGLVSLE